MGEVLEKSTLPKEPAKKSWHGLVFLEYWFGSVLKFQN